MTTQSEPDSPKRKLAEAQTREAQLVPNTTEPKPEPKLRHEFVGMMFALAIGEVGVQTAALVQGHHWVHFLPAYSHLLLATIVIATSWVGWTLSPAPGARQDVGGIFQREFLVLLVDVFLVVVYFILVKTVDFSGERPIRLNASAKPEAFWILVIFAVYLFWDVLTKIVDYQLRDQPKSWKEWRTKYGVRMLPTLLCLAIAIFTKQFFDRADPPHVLTADLALLSLVLLFRAGKGLAPSPTGSAISKRWSWFWTVLCLLGLVFGTLWTARSWPMPKCIVAQILTEPAQQGQPETPATSILDSK
jgi:hypothetical protein